jgi:hypothetical protein
LVKEFFAEIETLLGQGTDNSYKAQELRAERAALGNMRLEIEQGLRPTPKPARSPELQRLYDKQRNAHRKLTCSINMEAHYGERCTPLRLS